MAQSQLKQTGIRANPDNVEIVRLLPKWKVEIWNGIGGLDHYPRIAVEAKE
jgi:hypothetical protein